MKRRNFLKSAAGGAGAAFTWLASGNPAAGLPARPVLAGVSGRPPGAGETVPSPAHFTPCINQATTMKADYRTAMDAYAKAGFRQVELWLESVEPFLQKEPAAAARRVMADLGIEPVSSCCEGDLFYPRLQGREKGIEGFKRKLDLSSQLGAHRFVMYSAISEGVKTADYDAALPRLREIGDLGRQFDIVVGIEFIAGAKFLGCVETTANLLRKVAHPNLGIQFDTFHFYAGISKLEDIENLKPGEISFVHIDDVPAMSRELLEDEHRVYVGDGVMPHLRILRALAKVYQGPLSLELFQYAEQDPYVVARRGFEGLSRLLARV